MQEFEFKVHFKLYSKCYLNEILNKRQNTESKFYFGFRDQKPVKEKNIENVETVANSNRDQNNGLNLRFNQNLLHKIIRNGTFELNFKCERPLAKFWHSCSV